MAFEKRIIYFIAWFLHFSEGICQNIIEKDKEVVTVPGQDISLNCTLVTDAEAFIVQVEWKSSNKENKKVAVYNPTLGKLHYRNESQVFYKKVNETMHATELFLHMVDTSDSGQYSCIFVTYPTGSFHGVIRLTVVDTQKEKISRTVKGQVNKSLLLQCLEDIPYVTENHFTFEWTVKHNETEESIISAKWPRTAENNSLPYGNQFQFHSNLSLSITSLKFTDEEKEYICKIGLPGSQISRHFTIKVLGETLKPELQVFYQYILPHTVAVNSTCLIRNASPEPKVKWYFDRQLLEATYNGYLVTPIYDKGLHQLKSLLFLSINDSLNDHSLKCEGLYTEPSNETVRIGSDTVNVSAHPAHNISINIMQEKQFIAEGDDVIILCMSSVPADKYIFLAGKQRTAIHNGTSNEVILQKIRRSQSGVYICRPQWSDFDSFKEENIEIFVNYLDDIECSHSHLIEVEKFHDLNISCFSNASKPPVYSWIKGASIISHCSSLILTNITKPRVGRYTVTAEIPGSSLKRQKEIMVLLDEGNIMPLTNIPDTPGTTLNGYNSSQVARTSYIQKTEDKSGITTSPSNIITRYTTVDPEGKTASTETSSQFTLTNVTLLKENPNSSALLSTRDNANLILSVNAVSIYKNETTDPVNGRSEVRQFLAFVIIPVTICVTLVIIMIKRHLWLKSLDAPPPFKPPPPPIKYKHVDGYDMKEIIKESPVVNW
ncbi:basal cell adhesion molecule [Erpetoichthys calabaricus]|uniref:basal cell adhesion molecule n=1 Tax=Erpetoichthys calabaricus TaxID=27687 RepID=UPI0022342A3C|nr:basal cell adhesion molecule [Erpetoichthys calabaricus]